MENTSDQNTTPVPATTGKEVKPLRSGVNPFASGFKPNGRKKKGQSYLTKRSLLRMMLEQPITVQDLPTALADRIRAKYPGMFEAVDKKFTMYQLMEIVQLNLLFSKSDYVKQDAINAIKDRVEGKPMQMVQVQNLEAEPTQFILPGGRTITI